MEKMLYFRYDFSPLPKLLIREFRSCYLLRVYLVISNAFTREIST